MRSGQRRRDRRSREFSRVALRCITDEEAGLEIVEHVTGHPGAGEWRIAQALCIPLRQAHRVTRELETRGILTR